MNESTKTTETKKPYTPPTVTKLGNVVTTTKGMAGDSYEFTGSKPFSW
jgi:hypothetical protein